MIKPRLIAISDIQVERRAVRRFRITITVLFFAIFAINLGASAMPSSPLQRTHLTAALLALYLLLEARIYLRRSDLLGLLSPALLALIFHFVLSYLLGITFSVFFPWIIQRYEFWLPDLDGALSDMLILAGLAAFCMLRGYAIGRPLARLLRRVVKATPLMRREMRPVFGLILGMQAVYLLLVVYAIQIGVYGLISTPEARTQHVDMLRILSLALATGTLSYFLILLRHFERCEAGLDSFLSKVSVSMLIMLHVMVGALSAFKSQIVFPFVIAGFAYFLATRRMPIRFVAYACIALVVAYAVIEPFRSYLGVRGTSPSSLTAAVQAFGTALNQREQLTHYSSISQAEAIASRFDISGMAAIAIAFVDRGDLQTDYRNQFQNSILLAPILAYVPRAVWPGKPSYSEGVWFNQSVLGRLNDENTSVGMGPIGYLYMAGDISAVILGFLSFGILQALVFEGFARAGSGGLIVFFSVAVVLISIPTSFGPTVTGVLQMLPLAFVAQFIILRPAPGRGISAH
ncbi:MAG: hypothetical protein Q27BPR15_12390 [Rhodobacter sp. CACIA14H1]|nr:MAG: hypothetical protein Q27BPR15_12390 [Rhodobacter sp. CACIA14H1]